MDRPVPLKTLLRWSESLSAIARTGLGFTESLYEQERFEEILKVAADIRAETDENPEAVEDADGLVQEWMDTVGKGVPGYVTPKVAVGAAVGNDQGELLLIQRADSGIWLYPTGWCDVGYSAAEVVVKEVEEETGIEVEPVRLIAVLDGLRLGFTRVPLYSLVFYCRAVGGTLEAHPLECRDVGWFTRDTLPDADGGGGTLGRAGLRRAGGRATRRPLRQRPPTHVARRRRLIEDLMTLTVKAAETADGGLRDAVATLIPQLSSSSPPPDLDQLGRIIADPATTLLLAHQDDLLVGMLTLAVFQTPDRRARLDRRRGGRRRRPRCRRGQCAGRGRARSGRSGGARTVDLTSRPSREAANRLYLRLGFELRETNVYRYSST